MKLVSKDDDSFVKFLFVNNPGKETCLKFIRHHDPRIANLTMKLVQTESEVSFKPGNADADRNILIGNTEIVYLSYYTPYPEKV